MPRFDSSKHLITLQRKEYILFPGLLALAHDTGNFIGVNRYTVQKPTEDNGYRAVVGATANFLVTDSAGQIIRKGDGDPLIASYSAEGDASPKDVSRNLVPALLRMAETRAVARALRFATASDYTAYDELPPQEPAESGDGRPS